MLPYHSAGRVGHEPVNPPTKTTPLHPAPSLLPLLAAIDFKNGLPPQPGAAGCSPVSTDGHLAVGASCATGLSVVFSVVKALSVTVICSVFGNIYLWSCFSDVQKLEGWL